MKLLQSELAVVPDDDRAWCSREATGSALASRVPAVALVSAVGVVQIMRAEMDLGRRKAQVEMESICRDDPPAESVARGRKERFAYCCSTHNMRPIGHD